MNTCRAASGSAGALVARMTIVLASVLLATGCSREADVTLFEEASRESGLASYSGMTHGAAWGDVDGDGKPDLYVTNHLEAPRLFRNLGGGRFEDVTARWFDPAQTAGDKHGAVWADFDNDGRLDLVQLTGAVRGVGAEPKRLFHHRGDRLLDAAEPLGVLNPEGRTRMPLWLDLNGDGRLDLFQGAEARLDDKRPPFAFMQAEGRFDADDLALMLGSRGAPFCVLTELTGDQRPDLVCRLLGKEGTVQVFDLAKLPARTLQLLPTTAFEDLAAADFDNDGAIDVFMARRNPPGAVALGRPSARELVLSTEADAKLAGQAIGVDFEATGPLQVQVASGFPADAITPQRVWLGAAAAHPGSLEFSVPASAGAARLPAGITEHGVYIGSADGKTWQVRVVAAPGSKPQRLEAQVRITAAADITEAKPVGPSQAEEAPARLFMNRGGRMVEEGEKRGVNRRLVAGMNVVAADFDNDMDVDLFVLASGDAGQRENLLLLNDGKGHFTPVKAAGGAAGTPRGVGDSVTTADVDGDGRLDLLLASGGSMGRSLGLPSDGGGYQLFRNVASSGHHWLMIDLQGTRSNRDGIGAIVTVTAGGITQTRVQDGGVHHRSQNHARLHFGMGKNPEVERITVRWPSGTVQALAGVKSDQVLRVVEPPGASP